ncbi:MAG: glycosyltransferase [Anaerolineales bacterium]|nr:glycosyltransferase [Anaerolineales bacterium]
MTNNPKIAYILSRFPYLTETFILREMILLRKSGLEVHVFSMFPPLPTPVHQEAQEMLPYTHYSPYLLSSKLLLAHLYFLLHTPVQYVRAIAKAVWQTYREPLVLLRVLLTWPKTVYFARQMQELNIEHIHAHFVWVNGIAAGVASDLIGATFSLHPHAFGLFMRDQEDIRRQLQMADGVVTVSEYHRQYIADLCPRLHPDDIKIVHYGLEPTEFPPAQHSPTDNTIRIISIGSLMEKKGHAYLIDACDRLVERGYAFQCSIVGGGPLKEMLQARIDEKNLQAYVSLLGNKTQAEIKELYRQSDIFVLACVVAKNGDRDGLPNVLLEALAMEIPVVTTPVTGIPELVHDGETGLLVPERDTEALVQAIEKLINDETLRRRLGQQGRQVVLAEFDIRETAPQLARIFDDIHNGQDKR